MNLYKRIQLALAKRWFGYSDENLPIMQALGIPGETTQKKAIDQYNGIVYACVSAIAEEVATAEHYIKKLDRNNEYQRMATQHEFMRLLDKPNPLMTKYELLEATQSFIEMAGEVFWIFALGEITKRPKEVYLMRPDKMEVAIDDDGSVKGYVLIKKHGERVLFMPQEILHFKMFNPYNSYRGLGTVQAAMTYIETEKFASEFRRNFLYNNATPTGILSLQKNVNKEVAEKFKRMWSEGLTGTENAGKIAIVREMDVKFEKIGLSLGDIDLKALGDLTEESIMKMFRVPKGILAISDESGLGRASVETLEYIFMKRVVDPKIKRIDDILQQAIDRFYKKEKLKVDHDSVVPADKDYKLKLLESGTDKWITRDEAREETGYGAVGAELLYNEINKLPIDLPGAQSKGLKQTFKINIKSNKTEKTADPCPECFGKGSTYDITDKNDNARHEIYRKSVEQKIKAYVPIMIKKMRKYLDEQKAIVLEKIKPKKAFEESTFNAQQESAKLVELLNPVMYELSQQAGDEALKFAGSDNTFQITELITKVMREHAGKMAQNFSEETIDKLAKTLSEGFTNGESVNKLSQRVSTVYNEAKGYRTERVARNEAHWTAQKATRLAYEQTGYIKYKQWYANPGACQYCQTFDGQIIPLSESFFPQGAIVEGTEGGQFVTNYETIEEAHLHPNCFLHHSVPVTTEKGEVQISKIQIGDKVLTHRGIYQKVLNVFQGKHRYFGEAVQIRFRGSSKKITPLALIRNSVTVTPEHPFLTQRGWVLASNLINSDSLFVKAKTCSCGALIPYWKNYCSMSCQLTEPTRKKISHSKKGVRNWMFNRIGELHHLWEGGNIRHASKEWHEVRVEARKRDDAMCQNCGMTEEEHINKYGLSLDVHHINPYRQSKDNTLENLITLCKKCHRKIEHTEKRAILETGGQRFIDIPIIGIKHIDKFQGEKRYNLEVENDHSYIAKGIVTHNCECTILSLTEAKSAPKEITKVQESEVATEVDLKQLKKAKKMLNEAKEISELLDDIEL